MVLNFRDPERDNRNTSRCHKPLALFVQAVVEIPKIKLSNGSLVSASFLAALSSHAVDPCLTEDPLT